MRLHTTKGCINQKNVYDMVDILNEYNGIRDSMHTTIEIDTIHYSQQEVVLHSMICNLNHPCPLNYSRSLHFLEI